MTEKATASTESLITFLRDPASYPHRPAEVEIRQTHASVLAIAPPYVYKIKKHVNLGFLNFTGLADRKTNCERERQLNSRLCAGLYLGVLPIALKDNRLAFGSDGTVVEYALQMKQLAEGCFLDQLLQAGNVTLATLNLLLATLKRFYEQHPPDAAVSAYGAVEKIREIIEMNVTVLQQHTAGTVHPASLAVLQAYFQRFFEANAALLGKRVQERRIRDCHGDLHLEHIHIQQGKVCIYDCIEFNDRFRYIDVASDIAFLAMDFDFRGRPDFASYLISRMAALLQDPDLALLTDFYKCYRACVRAKVECIKAAETEVSALEQESSRKSAKQHVSLALQYALFGSRPAVLVVCGRSGSGKSTLAEGLAAVLGWKLVSSDVIRKQTAGLPLYQLTAPEARGTLYGQEVTDRVYQALLRETLAEVRQRRSIILDATFGQARYRALLREALAPLGVPLYFLELQASDDVIRARLAQREKCPQVVSDVRLADFELLRQLYQPPVEVPPAQLLSFDATPEPGAVVNRILERVASLRNLNVTL